MDTEKISLMKLIEAELQHRVEVTEPELSKIDMIVRLAEVRNSIENLQEARRKSVSSASVPSAGAQAS
jgi:hypothetical protein